MLYATYPSKSDWEALLLTSHAQGLFAPLSFLFSQLQFWAPVHGTAICWMLGRELADLAECLFASASVCWPQERRELGIVAESLLALEFVRVRSGEARASAPCYFAGLKRCEDAH